MQNLLDYFTKPYETYTYFQIIIEFSAAFLGILSVFFAAKNNIWVFPTGIVSTALYVYILFVFHLFGDMTVNFYYFIMSIYGWIHWSGKDNDDIELPISYMSNIDFKFSIFMFLGSIFFVIIVYFVFQIANFDFVDLPNDKTKIFVFKLNWVNYIDVFTTSIFFVGMWLMAKKKIENWIFWIIGDILVIPMFFHKGLGITAIQYFIFLIPAIMGYINWKKQYQYSKLLA